MASCAGSDLSEQATHVCVVDEAGEVVFHGVCRTEPEILGKFRGHLTQLAIAEVVDCTPGERHANQGQLGCTDAMGGCAAGHGWLASSSTGERQLSAEWRSCRLQTFSMNRPMAALAWARLR